MAIYTSAYKDGRISHTLSIEIKLEIYKNIISEEISWINKDKAKKNKKPEISKIPKYKGQVNTKSITIDTEQ